MKKILVCVVIFLIAFGITCSGCSKAEEPKAEKERNEIADEITDRIKSPIDQANAIKTKEDARVEEQADMVEEQ